MKNFFLIIIFILGIILLINSCINLKSEYPKINYYKFFDDKSNFKKNLKINASCQIRNFTINEELDNEHLVQVNEDKSIQKYYYHRWLGDLKIMVTDYYVNKFNDFNLFADGVFKSNSIRIPDFIIEGQILEFIAFNTLNNKTVSITIRISLLKKDFNAAKYTVIFSNNYHISVPRVDNSVKSIVDAYSIGLNNISDKLMNDLIEHIGKNEVSQ